jgi:hypothetical protein
MKCKTRYCRNQRVKGRTVCQKCRLRKWRATHPERAAYRTLCDNAKSRDRKVEFSYEEFLTLIVNTGYAENRGRHPGNLHIDRHDPLKGYTLENCRIITCAENCAKAYHDKHHHARQRAEESNTPF